MTLLEAGPVPFAEAAPPGADWADAKTALAGGPVEIDPVPRLITRAEWTGLEAGIAQRVRALDRFVADVYGTQQIVRAGVIPSRVIASAQHFEPRLLGSGSPARTWITVANMDIVRCPDGTFQVLEDNVRTPAGLGYALEVRRRVGEVVPADGVRPLDGIVDALRAAMLARAPEGAADPHMVLLSDGPSGTNFAEHTMLAGLLGVPLVTVGELCVRNGRLHAGNRPVDVVYRRTDEDRVVDERSGLTRVAALLVAPWQDGRLGLVNAFGTGIADDKLLHAYVDGMVRFYLGEEPLLRSVPTLLLSHPTAMTRALERLPELVVKPRAGAGGRGVVICSEAGTAERERLADLIVRQPMHYVLQERVALSRHPTVVDGTLEPRAIDLRPFAVLSGDEVSVMPGGLTRVASGAEGLVVNSSRGGGVKDTRVLQ